MSSTQFVDLRQRMIHAVEARASRHRTVERLGVSLASASRWCGHFARAGQSRRPHAFKPRSGKSNLRSEV